LKFVSVTTTVDLRHLAAQKQWPPASAARVHLLTKWLISVLR